MTSRNFGPRYNNWTHVKDEADGKIVNSRRSASDEAKLKRQQEATVSAKIQTMLEAGRDLSGPTLERAGLRLCSLDHALQGVRLEHCDLHLTDLSRSELTAADLSNVFGAGAIFNRAVLNGAVLSHAQLEGASFQHADLMGANFANAKLTDVDFTDAFLDGADFSGALLDTNALRACKSCRSTRLPDGTYSVSARPASAIRSSRRPPVH